MVALVGSRSSSIFGPAGGIERDALELKALETNTPIEFVQVWRGSRVLTRVMSGSIPGRPGPVLAIAFMPQPAISEPPAQPPIHVVETSHLGPFASLSRRELEVLYLVGVGSRTTIAADRLFRSEKTISNHLTRILRKLNLQSRAGLARLVAERGLLLFTFDEWSRIAAKAVRSDEESPNPDLLNGAEGDGTQSNGKPIDADHSDG